MQATLDSTNTRTLEGRARRRYDVPDQVPFLPNGTMVVGGQTVFTFVAHRNARCEECEWTLDNERRHPRVEQHENLVTVCGGHIVKLVD